MIEAREILCSENPSGDRLMTMWCRYPKFVQWGAPARGPRRGARRRLCDRRRTGPRTAAPLVGWRGRSVIFAFALAAALGAVDYELVLPPAYYVIGEGPICAKSAESCGLVRFRG